MSKVLRIPDPLIPTVEKLIADHRQRIAARGLQPATAADLTPYTDDLPAMDDQAWQDARVVDWDAVDEA